MKKITLPFIILFSACILSACHGNKNSEGDDADDTATALIDTSKNATIVVGKDDIKFITDVASACLAEIKIGNLAKQKGQDKRIKNFGAMMIKDLTKANMKLMALAKAKKITLPDSITTDEQKDIDELAKRSGKDFDTAYINQTQTDHKKAIDMFLNASKHAYDPDIKAFAAKHMLPLKRHLDAIGAIQDSMK